MRVIVSAMFLALIAAVAISAVFSHDVSELEVVEDKREKEKIQIKLPQKVEAVPETPASQPNADSALSPQSEPLQMRQFAGLLGTGAGPGMNVGSDQESTSQLIDQARNQDRAPQVLNRGKLEFPAGAKAKNQKGFVIFKTLVSESGSSLETQIVKSEPPGVFDSTVLQSLKFWKFSPGISKGKVVSMWLTQKVRFDFE